jgi:recombination associated protein RdgC
MWFKNLRIFQLTQDINLEPEFVEDQLGEFSFRPCGSQEMTSTGWYSPFKQGDTLTHSAAGFLWINLRKQERILPAAVVNAELQEKVAKVESDTGSAVGKKQQQEFKEDIINRLLPQAFLKHGDIQGFISVKEGLIIIDTSSDTKAELFLAMLRKALGSLPVVPFANRSISPDLTDWLANDNANEQFELLEEVELQHPGEQASTVKCKNQDLHAKEVLLHIEAGKEVQKIALNWDDSLTMLLQEDVAVKRLKFADTVKEQNDDIPKDEKLARMDADFVLMAGEINRLALEMKSIFDFTRD